MKEELCEKVVKVRRKSDRMMAMVLIFEKGVIRVTCAYGPHSERPDAEKDRFYDEMAREWNLGCTGEMVIGFGDINGNIGKRMDDF